METIKKVLELKRDLIGKRNHLENRKNENYEKIAVYEYVITQLEGIAPNEDQKV